MPLSDPKLWKLIGTWPLPSRAAPTWSDPNHRVDFAALLYGSTDLTRQSVERLIEIYRKFLYLRAISPDPLTPSTIVDTAWHLHLEFAGEYLALCRATGRELRHYNRLTHVELDEGYHAGLALYEAEFDAPPDDEYWPSPAAIADRKARERVSAILFFTLFMLLAVAAKADSPGVWTMFGVTLFLGIGVYIWAGWRWPRKAEPEHERTAG